MRPAPVARVVGFNLAVLLAMLGVFEVALRLAGVRFPAFYQPDWARGYALRPGASGLWSREGRAHVTINADGLRDGPHPRQTPPGVLRVAVLGDSFSEALQVDQDQTWWHQLEHHLNTRNPCAFREGFPKGVEMINFGVGGYGTGQELLTWRLQARAFQPRIVLLAMYLGNDIQDNTPQPRGDKPVFRLGPEGGLVIDNAFRSSSGSRFRFSALGGALNEVLNRSALLQLANEAKNRWSGRQPHPTAGPSRPTMHLERDDASGWAVTEALLRQLRDEVRAKGATLVVTSLSTPEQVWPDQSERQKVFREARQDPFARERRLAGLLQTLKVPYVPLAEDLQRQADQDGLILHGFSGKNLGSGHWNVTGHRWAATLLARRLCAPGEAP